jgi:hypothetical protein
VRATGAILAALLLCAGSGAAQESARDTLSEYFAFSDPSPFSCLLALFPPLLIQHGNEMKDFVRSDEFARVRKAFGDARAVDAIFVRAMRLTGNNTGMALLISAIATFDHDMVGVKNPVLSIVFPLTSETDADFRARRERLPSHFYADSPPGAGGDRDKLQHFFGSAFITYAFESPETAGRFGDFVEHGEDALIIGGVLDERDIRANRQGQLFGAALLDDNKRYPSDFLRAVIVSAPRDTSISSGAR